jgi:CO dehydrogenase maturation factor
MCGAHAAVRHLLNGILQEEQVVTVIDMEAGLEHLSRGTDRHVDVLLVVAEPYFKALETSRRCVELGRELKIPRVVVVANKYRSADELTAIRNYVAKYGLPLIGEVPFDPHVTRADQAGEAPALDEDSAAVSAIGKIVDGLGLSSRTELD